jgi:hypothetical protein
MIVSDAYVRDHVQFARAENIAIAIELVRARPLFDQSREQFHQFLTVQASIRGLPAVMMIDKNLSIVDQADTQITEAAFVKPSPEVLAAVNDTEPQSRCSRCRYVAAIIKQCNYGDTYHTSPGCSTAGADAVAGDGGGIAQFADLEAAGSAFRSPLPCLHGDAPACCFGGVPGST